MAARWLLLYVTLQTCHGLAGFGAMKKASKPKKKKKRPRPMSEWRKPGNVLPRTARPVPESIMRPDYANSGTPRAVDLRPSWMIEVKSKKDIEMMRAAGRCAREVLDATGRAVKPGVTTDELDAVAHAATIERGAYPSPLNYHGFPKSICTSVNEVICHGIPDDIPLKEGDVVNVDITVYLNGYHGDCSEMFYVGQVDDKSVKLVEATYDCWQAAIEACKPGVNYKQLGGIIEESIQGTGYKSVQQFCGHGIGKLFHTNPNVLHYKNSEPNGVMAVGHTFTIEPMICEGTIQSNLWADDWTAVTKDGGRSAQFEHTLLITEDGVEALTGKIESSPLQPWEESRGGWKVKWPSS